SSLCRSVPQFMGIIGVSGPVLKVRRYRSPSTRAPFSEERGAALQWRQWPRPRGGQKEDSVAQSNGQAHERVWDRFLTEQDRAHVAMSSRREKGFGQRPALLIIDMYRWVFGDKPEPLLDAVKTWPGSCGLAGWEALP